MRLVHTKPRRHEMTKTITITDPRQVKTRDKAYFKDCDFGFTVTRVDTDDEDRPFAVYDPLSRDYYWIPPSRFDHATREVKEPEWPKPSDLEMHVYLGADGKQYLYAPSYEGDPVSWYIDNDWHGAKEMTEYHPEALPLKELKLVPKEEKS